jgi:uncharacterized membrane protein YoaT (DUF817 family)
MSNFWSNVSRYPRFFISSMIGLILIILAPIKNLLKIPRLRVFLIIFLVTVLIMLYLVLENMAGL